MRFRIKKFQLSSHFKTNLLQRVRFQDNFFKTRQIWNKLLRSFQFLSQKFYNVSDFVSEKIFKSQILHKNVQSKTHVLTEITT